MEGGDEGGLRSTRALPATPSASAARGRGRRRPRRWRRRPCDHTPAPERHRRRRPIGPHHPYRADQHRPLGAGVPRSDHGTRWPASTSHRASVEHLVLDAAEAPQVVRAHQGDVRACAAPVDFAARGRTASWAGTGATARGRGAIIRSMTSANAWVVAVTRSSRVGQVGNLDRLLDHEPVAAAVARSSSPPAAGWPRSGRPASPARRAASSARRRTSPAPPPRQVAVRHQRDRASGLEPAEQGGRSACRSPPATTTSMPILRRRSMNHSTRRRLGRASAAASTGAPWLADAAPADSQLPVWGKRQDHPASRLGRPLQALRVDHQAGGEDVGDPARGDPEHLGPVAPVAGEHLPRPRRGGRLGSHHPGQMGRRTRRKRRGATNEPAQPMPSPSRRATASGNSEMTAAASRNRA